MKHFRKYSTNFALVTAIALAAVTNVTGCSNDDQNHRVEQGTGTVALAVDLGSVADITYVDYEISGPSFQKTGSIPVTEAKLTARIGGIPAAAGNVLVLRAFDKLGTLSCEASATFEVKAGQATPLSIVLRCHLTHKTGSVVINGKINVCPLIDEMTVIPASAPVGQSITLSASASDLDQGPQAPTFTWSATGHGLTADGSTRASFLCTDLGTFEVTARATDGDCEDTVSTSIVCTPSAMSSVYASMETEPVAHSGDAADDPAIWVNPSDPSLSVVIGTDKSANGGLGVYALDGTKIQTVNAGMLNNVDLRDGFPLGAGRTTLVTAGNRTNNSIAMFTLDPATRMLTDVAEGPIATLATYGSCMYHSRKTGKFYYFVDSKAGAIEQWELSESSTQPGKVTAIKVRDLKQLASQPEACAVDDENGQLYVGEEDVGIWKFDAEPDATSGGGWAGELIQNTSASGHLVADVEGIAIVHTDATHGYLLSSNQGDSTYAVFDLKPPHAWIKTFRVARGKTCIDEVTGSDGIEATAANLGPAFPHGLLVTQDDTNDSGNQNFKLVPLGEILGATPVVDDSMCGAGAVTDAGPTGGSSDAGNSSTGWGLQFCLDFCQKCSTCYATGTFSEGDCHYLTVKPNFSLDDCAAGCALGLTPGAAAFAGLTTGWQDRSCVEFDAAM